MTQQQRSLLSKILGVLLYFLVVTYWANAQVTSDFSSSADGWTVFNGNTGAYTAPTYSSTGGNPGGYISFSTLAGNANIFFYAPAKFLGNLSSSYNQNLSFDLQQSTAGTDNTNGDLIITGPAGSLFYQLPTKPSSTGWSSYSVKLNETFANWHYGGPTGAVPLQVQMKSILANVTSISIRVKYIIGNTFSVTGQLDNVILNVPTLGSPPTITSFTPQSAVAGASVVINGTNFNSSTSLNTVYFNGTKATVTNANATQLMVKVPTSAAYGPLVVINNASGLAGSSAKSFNPLFDNNKDFGGRIIPASMSRGYYSILKTGNESSNSFGAMDKGDIDGDGWMDMIVTETSNATITVYRNQGTGGALSSSTFATPITLPSMSGIPGGGPGLSEVMLVDVDNDGLLDVAGSASSNLFSGTGFLFVYHNISTPGTISFANPVFFSYNYYASLTMAAGDLDGDGRVDFAFTTGTSPGNIFISRNQSTPGNVDFSFGGTIGPTPTSGLSDIVIADLNNDGKPEVICPGYNAATISIYKNNSTPGTINMAAAFTIPSVVSYTNQIVVTDLDADGLLDMAWSTYNAQYVYFTKNIFSGSTFDATSFGSTIQIANTLSNPEGISVADINSDGKPDIVLSGYSDVAVMQNVGTGALSATSFMPTTVFQGSAASQAIVGTSPAIADFDGDNKPDIAISYRNNAISTSDKGVFLFRNENYPVPSVTSSTPASAAVATTATLNGNLMYTGNTNPSVRLGKVIGALSGTPSNTATAVTIPAGAASGKWFLTNHGLTTKGSLFNLTFNTNHIINATSFGPNVDFALANGTVYDNLEAADFDDDGRLDFVFRDANGTGIYQNAATAGQTITASSLSKYASSFVGGVNSFLIDIDGDGKIDLSNANQLFQNTSSGSISFAAGTTTNANSYTGSASGDFNNDGKTDVVLLNGSTSIRVYENLSTRGTFTFGTFTTFNNSSIILNPSSATAHNGSTVVEDFDGDGYDDILSVLPSGNQFVAYRNTKTFGPITSSSFALNGYVTTSGTTPQAVATADFDGDGKTDIVICYLNQTKISVYRNISTVGTISFATPVDFTDVTQGYGVAAQDLDGDGKPEIVVIHQVVTGSGGSFTIFQNITSGSTINFATGVNTVLTRKPQAVAIADVNSDQKPDILILGSGGAAAPTNAIMVFENKIPNVTITITTLPSDFIACVGDIATYTTAATGTTNITYQWQYSPDGIAPFTDIANGGGYSNVSTATLSVNTAGNFGVGRYRCKINGDFAATVYTTDEGLFVNAIPAAPGVTGASACPNVAITLNATGGTNGLYRWYTTATGGTAIAGETNSAYQTPPLTTTTTYYVSVVNSANCESPRVAVTASVINCTPPVITAQDLGTQIGGVVTLSLAPLITVATGATLDLTSLQIITPPASGARATIDATGKLTVDYTGISFSGIETITIKACDSNGQCSQQNFAVEVAGDIIVYNALSPNGANPTLVLQYIDIIPETKTNTVQIFDRWENRVWHGENYDNSSVVFKGTSDNGGELPTGIYFYRIDFASGKKTKTGFISLKR